MPSFCVDETGYRSIELSSQSIEPFMELYVFPTESLQPSLEQLVEMLQDDDGDLTVEILFQGLFNTVRIADEAEIGLEILGYELASQVPHVDPDQFTQFLQALIAAGMELREWMNHLQLYRRGVCPYVVVESRMNGFVLKRQDVYLRDLRNEFNTRPRIGPST